MDKNESALFWWLAENYVRLKLGVLEPKHKAKLKDLDKKLNMSWDKHVEDELGINADFFKSDEFVEIILAYLK